MIFKKKEELTEEEKIIKQEAELVAKESKYYIVIPKTIKFLKSGAIEVQNSNGDLILLPDSAIGTINKFIKTGAEINKIYEV